MQYRRFDGKVGDYTVDPLHLAAYHGEWYLFADHTRRGKIVSFAMSRIRSIEGTGVQFPEPEPERLRAALDERFGVMGGEELLDVHLRFGPAVAAYIAGRVWHPSQRMRTRRDGSLDLRMKTRGWKELVRFVLSWQPDVQVLRPVALRTRVIEKMREGMERHAQ